MSDTNRFQEMRIALSRMGYAAPVSEEEIGARWDELALTLARTVNESARKADLYRYRDALERIARVKPALMHTHDQHEVFVYLADHNPTAIAGVALSGKEPQHD